MLIKNRITPHQFVTRTRMLQAQRFIRENLAQLEKRLLCKDHFF